MPAYSVTDKAGAYVAGQRNPGVGAVLYLTEDQAAYELLLGTLAPSGWVQGTTEDGKPCRQELPEEGPPADPPPLPDGGGEDPAAP